MNVPVFNGATTATPVAPRLDAPRPQGASHEPVFTVPMEAPAEPVESLQHLRIDVRSLAGGAR